MSINSQKDSVLTLNRLTGLASQSAIIQGFARAGYYQLSIQLSDKDTLEGSFLVEFDRLNSLKVSNFGRSSNATWSLFQPNVPQVHIRAAPRRSTLPQFEIILIANQSELSIGTQAIRATGAAHTGETLVYVNRFLP